MTEGKLYPCRFCGHQPIKSNWDNNDLTVNNALACPKCANCIELGMLTLTDDALVELWQARNESNNPFLENK